MFDSMASAGREEVSAEDECASLSPVEAHEAPAFAVFPLTPS
jgi:hypothetical protein